MRDDFPGRVPDYTSACIVMFGVNVTWILVAIWAIWGLIAAILLGAGVNRVISWVDARSDARREAAIRRGKG